MVEQDIKKFHESIGNELDSLKNRVRNLIGDNHWLPEGRYKEAVLKNIIKRFLPDGYAIGTGFVINGEKDVTNEIDIIIYDNSSPVLFREGDFVIVLAYTVRAIIEVKTKISSIGVLKRIIKKCEEDAAKIKGIYNTNRPFFNGIFAYDSNLSFDSIERSLKEYFFHSETDFLRKVNNISLGKDKFIHLWNENPINLKGYQLENLSFSYFISNLLCLFDKNPIFWEHNSLLFPLESKDPFRRFCINAN